LFALNRKKSEENDSRSSETLMQSKYQWAALDNIRHARLNVKLRITSTADMPDAQSEPGLLMSWWKSVEIFRKIARTFGRSDTLIGIQQNFCPRMGYNSARGESNDALKTKLHTLIADGAAVLRDICPTGE
jgi:hypothetical protein